MKQLVTKAGTASGERFLPVPLPLVMVQACCSGAPATVGSLRKPHGLALTTNVITAEVMPLSRVRLIHDGSRYMTVWW